MILRIWRARTTAAGLEALTRDIDATLLPELRNVAGFGGALLGMRPVADGAFEILVETRWDSEEALRTFVGQDVEAAVVGSQVAGHLLSFEERAPAYEVIIEDRATPVPPGCKAA